MDLKSTVKLSNESGKGAALESLEEIIVFGLEEKKGKDIVMLDLQALPEAVAQSFIICTGESVRQVDALTDSVIDEVKKALGERPWHVEGKETSHWVLLDFVDVVVHIFLKEYREFYGIEELWNDAVRVEYGKDLA